MIQIQVAIREGVFVLDPHAVLRQTQRGITQNDILEAIGDDRPEIIKEYPDTHSGYQCLVRGECGERIVHALFIRTNPLILKTVYEPDPVQWDAGFRVNRRWT
jgi:hypothetical protein